MKKIMFLIMLMFVGLVLSSFTEKPMGLDPPSDYEIIVEDVESLFPVVSSFDESVKPIKVMEVEISPGDYFSYDACSAKQSEVDIYIEIYCFEHAIVYKNKSTLQDCNHMLLYNNRQLINKTRYIGTTDDYRYLKIAGTEV